MENIRALKMCSVTVGIIVEACSNRYWTQDFFKYMIPYSFSWVCKVNYFNSGLAEASSRIKILFGLDYS